MSAIFDGYFDPARLSIINNSPGLVKIDVAYGAAIVAITVTGDNDTPRKLREENAALRRKLDAMRAILEGK